MISHETNQKQSNYKAEPLSSELFLLFHFFKVVHSLELIIADSFFWSWHLTVDFRDLLAHVHNVLRFFFHNLVHFFGRDFLLFLDYLWLVWRKNLSLSWSLIKQHWFMNVWTRLHDLTQGLSHFGLKLIYSDDSRVLRFLHVRTG